MIWLSSHQDKVMNNIDLSFDRGIMTGLLDNWAGMLVTYLALFDDPNMLILEKEGKLKIWHSMDEEWGNPRGLPEADKENDIIIVVDVASGPQYEGLDFSLENINGIKTKEIEENLKWEGFNFSVKPFNGDPKDADEAWVWKEQGYKVMSFIIPIEGAWHKPNCTINTYQLSRTKQALKRLVNYLL